MTRIEELRRKYPEMPPEVIVKWEVTSRGIRDTENIDKVSDWVRALPTYQSYDHDVSLKEVVDKGPGRLRPGYVLRPGTMFMKNGLGTAIQRDSKSPYEIRDLGEGQFALFEGEEKVAMDIYFPLHKQRTTPEPVTSKGTPASSLVSLNRRCFMIVPVRYCEYFALGEQCKFCNFNATQEDARAIGVDRRITIDLDETVEAYKITSSETRLVEGRMEMGGFRNSEQEGSIFFGFVEKIASATPYKPNLTVLTEALDRKKYQRLRDRGLDCITLQLEVWDPRLFAEICPGKAKHSPHERWLEACQEAVDVFGPGRVGVKIIAGLTLIPPDGHKTWQEARDSHIEGNRWLIKHGAVPGFTNLRLPPGSVYGEDATNQERLPPTEYYLDLALAHDAAMTEYGLYDKMNKFMRCGLCCASSYSGEIGILARFGDMGKWMADCVRDEDNWLVQFLSSIRQSARTL